MRIYSDADLELIADTLLPYDAALIKAGSQSDKDQVWGTQLAYMALWGLGKRGLVEFSAELKSASGRTKAFPLHLTDDGVALAQCVKKREEMS